MGTNIVVLSPPHTDLGEEGVKILFSEVVPEQTPILRYLASANFGA